MTCQQIKKHFEAISDPAVDPRIRMQVESHLSECPDCERTFADLHELDGNLQSILSTGSRTPALWDRIEAILLEETKSFAPEVRRREDLDFTPWQRLKLAAKRWLAATSPPVQATWGCLIGTWAIIFVLNMSSHTSEIRPSTPAAIASTEASSTATRQHLMAVELAVFSESFAGPKHDHPGPRTDLTAEHQNA